MWQKIFWGAERDARFAHPPDVGRDQVGGEGGGAERVEGGELGTQRVDRQNQPAAAGGFQ